jgi:hypothetical protein
MNLESAIVKTREIMTKKQCIAIMADWWPAACRAQRWERDDRSLRLETVSQAVGRPISTMSDLDNAADIDQVKAYLRYLTDDLDGAFEAGNPDPGERRRLLWLIQRHSSALAVGNGQSAMSYAISLARDKFTITAGLSTIDDLTTEHLHQLMMTLWSRLVAKRRAGRNASLTSEEQFPDQVEFQPDSVPAECPF